MYKLICDNEKTATESDEVVRLFFPDGDGFDEIITLTCSLSDKMRVRIELLGKTYDFDTLLPSGDELNKKREYIRFNKLCLYKVLSEITGRKLPWGSLTGVRPTKLAYELTDKLGSVKSAVEELTGVYGVSAEKAKLLSEILKAQQGIYERNDKKINLYVHIPFCVSKCNYCAFITDILTPSYKLTEPYVEMLVEEIRRTVETLLSSGKEILSVYVGGGTPTALNEDQLERVLKAAYCGNVEYTCEAGRPDTVSEEKLRVMADCGVNRVCVNPQSLNDETLQRIGRRHSSADFYKTYAAAKKYPFVINTDLIAGLSCETAEIFADTLKGISELRPDNITVHTLSRKNGSQLKLSKYRENAEVESMVELSYGRLTEIGYSPYYLYRQKRMLGNLENVGYSLPGKQCVNNITTMEECVSVAACGAGAISKRIFTAENRIERMANLRDVRLYMQQFSDRLQKKLEFFR